MILWVSIKSILLESQKSSLYLIYTFNLIYTLKLRYIYSIKKNKNIKNIPYWGMI